MIHTDRVIVVEGKYDRIKLSNITDARIIQTDGFSVFKEPELQHLIRMLGEKHGVLLLTDSDGAGFAIRNFICGILPPEKIIHLYIPDVFGKERRKAHPSKEGKMGVEGISDSELERIIRSALNGEEKAAKSEDSITNCDLHEAGLTGGPEASVRRKQLTDKLGLPERITKKKLLDALNALYTKDEYLAIVKDL